MARLVPPFGGVGDQSAAVDADALVAPPTAMRNVRLVTQPDGRLRMGPRPGLSTFLLSGLAGSVQAIGLVPVATGATLTATDAGRIVGGETVDDPTGATGYRGCVFFVRPRATGEVDVGAQLRDPNATYQTWNAREVKFSSNELEDYRTTGAFITEGTIDYGGLIGVRKVNRIHYFRSPTGRTPDEPFTPEILWSAMIEDKEPGGVLPADPWDIISQSVVVYEPFVFVAAGIWVYIYAAEDIPGAGFAAGDYIARITMRNWAWSVDLLRVVYRANRAGPQPSGPQSGYGNSPRLLIGYNGSPTIGGAVTSDTNREGAYYRAAIAEYIIKKTTPTMPLEHVASLYGQDQIEQAVAAGDKGDWRTNRLTGTGRGRRILDFSLPQGTNDDPTVGVIGTKNQLVWPVANPLYLATTNDGFGPNSAAGNRPDGSGGYFNGHQIRCNDIGTPGAAIPDAIKWTREIDGNSIRRERPTASGWFNDIYHQPTTGLDPNRGYGPECSLNAVAFGDTNGNVYFGGSLVNGRCVYNCDGTDGSVFNTKSLGEMVIRGGLAFDRVTDKLIAITPRNNAWPGSASAYAFLFWLDPNTLAITHKFDLGASGIDPRAVAVNRAGWVAVATEYLA